MWYTSMPVDWNISIAERQRNEPINQWIYTVLWANIIELRLQPGQAISETEVSEVLGASRTPVREAFIRLTKDGLLQVLPQKGSKVSQIDLNQAREARFVRSAVEKAVMTDACHSFPQTVLGLLESNIAVQYDRLRSKVRAEFLIADNDFHRLIYQGCNKERTWSYIKRLDFNYDRLRTMTLPYVTEQVIDEHKRILDIIRIKDLASINEIIEQHLTWDVIDRVVSEYPARYFRRDERREIA